MAAFGFVSDKAERPDGGREADAAARVDFFRTKGGGSLEESGKGHAIPAAYGDLK